MTVDGVDTRSTRSEVHACRSAGQPVRQRDRPQDHPPPRRLVPLASPTTRSPDVARAQTRHRTTDSPARVLHAAPKGQPPLLADPSSSVAQRAAFATKTLWVTRYDPEPNASGRRADQPEPGRQRVTRMEEQGSGHRRAGHRRVAWFGLTHFPRVEDWPIMAGRHVRLRPEPVRFFDRQPHPGRARSDQRCTDGAPITPFHVGRVDAGAAAVRESCMCRLGPIRAGLFGLGAAAPVRRAVVLCWAVGRVVFAVV